MTDVCARTSPGAWIGLRRLICGLGLAVALLTVAGCHSTTFIPGTVIVTMSAKPGPFTSYVVTLEQIYLTRNDGNTATLPVVTQPVDLAQLYRNRNLIEVPPVVIGTYVSATFLLVYSGAISAYVDNQIIQAPAWDPAANAAAGTLTVTVTFDPNHPLVINNQNSTPLDLVIDLEASNLLVPSTTTGTGWQTNVKPFWTASTRPTYDTPIFARGDFVITDTKNNNFVLNTRPFRATLLNSTANGALTVNVNDQTYYQINGMTYVGATGLAAMAALQSTLATIPVAAYSPNTSSPFGSLNTITPSMNATEVYVGSSLESSIEDQATGIVSALNSDGSLTLTDMAFIDRTGNFYNYLQSAVLTVGPTTTIVSIDGVSNVTPTTQSISVGQFVNVIGQQLLDVNSNLQGMDATGTTVGGAQIRLQNTTLWGTLNSATPGTAFLNLQSVENVLAPTFIPTATNYQVGTGSIDESTTAAGTLLKVDGLATPQNTGPPYFTASAVSVPVNSQLVLQWDATNGNTSGSIAISGSQITINTSDPNLASPVIRTGPVTTVIQPPPGNVITITYNTTDPVNLPLYGTGSVALGELWFSDPNAFATKASSFLTANPVFKLVATGQYDPTTGTFNATSVTMNAK